MSGRLKGSIPSCVAALVMAGQAHAAVGRLFASPQQCESAKTLPAGACRTAFANAMAEFAAKAPTYRSRRACLKAFGPCMPWPIGTRRFSQFRPQWIGITLGADLTALPAVAPGRVSLTFVPQSTANLSPSASAPSPPADPQVGNEDAVKIMTPGDDGAGDSGPPARAGGGFTVIDGVLTYPAPARFQPKASKHP